MLDPERGRTGEDPAGGHRRGPRLAFVDALATGLLASGGKALARIAGLRGYSALIVDHDGTVHTTLGFPAADAVPARLLDCRKGPADADELPGMETIGDSSERPAVRPDLDAWADALRAAEGRRSVFRRGGDRSTGLWATTIQWLVRPSWCSPWPSLPSRATA